MQEFEITTRVALIVQTKCTAQTFEDALSFAKEQAKHRKNVLPLAKSVNIADEESELLSVSTGKWL
jgi:hypothetical protein